MILTEDTIRRMVGRGASGSGGGGVSPAGLAGYATQAWVAQNFLSIDFFNRLFKVHGATGDVLPNDTETTITDIEAVFGFWTEKYISALGKNSSGGGGGGSSTLAGLDDVQLNNPQNGQALVYNNGNWVNGTVIPDLTDYATKVWVQQQGYITASALTGYATESWVQQQGYITASALTGYATESWVTDKGYATETWVEGKGYALAANVYSKTDADAKFLTVAFFNRLFQAYNGTTSVNANDTTSTIDNIKAMFGFWTNQYISALGKNSSGGGGGGGSSTLAGLDDVQFGTLANGQALVYDSASSKWVNGTVTPDLTDYATKIWVQQQGYLTQHQSLAGYATESWVQQQGYLTASALTGYATESWVTGKGYATETWVEGKGYALAANVYSKTDADAKFLTVAFFNRLFQAYNGTTSVNANDTTSTIDNIKAMFGFWTNQYISALGKNSSGGGGGGSSTLAGLDDVQFGTLVNGQVPIYDSASGKWVNGTVTSDLTDYATKVWVQQQGYLTQHQSLAGYATESWVQQQGYITSSALTGYLPLSGGTMTGDLHLGSSAGVSPFIYFGDSSYVYIGEDADDHLTIKGNKGVNFIVGSGYNVTINSANIATQSWVQQQGYLTYETDPTVPAWAKAATKPSYSFYEIGGTVAFSQLPTLYWANVPVGSLSNAATTPTFSALNVTNDAVVGGSVNAKCMELSFSTPFIDFHHAVSNADFTSRFITTDYGVMSLQSKNNEGTSIASAFTIGEGFSGSYLQIGNIRVVYDSTNNALQIIKSDGTPAGLYTTGGLSALGMRAVASSITGFSQSVTFCSKAYFNDDIVINVGGTEMYLDTAKCVELGILS